MDGQARDEEAATTNNRQNRPMSTIPSFLFISFLLFMLTNHSGDEFLARHQYQDALQALQWQLSNYTAWMNGTTSNFTLPEHNPALTPLLNTFGINGQILDPNWYSYYTNITGFIHGLSHFYNITPNYLAANDTHGWKPYVEELMSDANLTTLPERLGTWDWLASEKIALSVAEKLLPATSEGEEFDNIALIRGKVELTNIKTSEDFRLDFEGVHFLSNGSIYGFAVPPTGHIDIRLLPALVPESVRNLTTHLVEPELAARIKKLRNLIDEGVLDQDSNSNEEPPQSTCSFVLYSQLEPANVPKRLMHELEAEIQHPTGAWTVKAPKLSLNGVLISEECGIMLEITKSEGLSSRTFFRKVTTYAASTGLLYLIMLMLFSRQARRSRTPSGISRVSRWTFLSQSAIDSVSFAGHITFAILAEGRPSLSLVAPSFLACILFLHEIQFALLVHQIQLPEDTAPPPIHSTPPTTTATQASANTTTTPASVTRAMPSAVGTMPTTIANPPSPATAPATTNRQQQSFFSFFIHHIRTDPQAKLWVMWFIFLSVIVRVILSPVLSMIFICLTHSTIWLPQIIRSARRGRSSGFTREYIIGVTLCRLALALYFIACPKNVLEVEPRNWAWLLAVFVCTQACILILQEQLGPSFFLPQRYAIKKTYDYHPPMPLPDTESPEMSLGDCSICMDAILVDPHSRSTPLDGKNEKGVSTSSNATSGSSSPGWRSSRTGGATAFLSAMQFGVENASARKNYSLAPCHHLFHTECLERWLAIKNICPQCRRPLPPL